MRSTLIERALGGCAARLLVRELRFGRFGLGSLLRTLLPAPAPVSRPLRSVGPRTMASPHESRDRRCR
jgi:hypothetical protein